MFYYPSGIPWSEIALCALVIFSNDDIVKGWILMENNTGIMRIYLILSGTLTKSVH